MDIFIYYRKLGMGHPSPHDIKSPDYSETVSVIMKYKKDNSNIKFQVG